LKRQVRRVGYTYLNEIILICRYVHFDIIPNEMSNFMYIILQYICNTEDNKQIVVSCSIDRIKNILLNENSECVIQQLCIPIQLQSNYTVIALTKNINY